MMMGTTHDDSNPPEEAAMMIFCLKMKDTNA
jgi:hypothetical protein